MAVAIKEGTLHEKAGGIEYKMPYKMAQALLKERKGDENKMHPYAYLVQVVNDQFGLKEHCSKVITY